MCHLGYTPCLADPDVWMRSAKQPDGSACWEYILLYVNDALAIGVNAEKMLREEIGCYFELKEASIGPPKIYLGGRMCQVILDNGMKVWGISLSQYVQSAVNNVEKYLKEKGQCLPKKADAHADILLPNVGCECQIGCRGGLVLHVIDWHTPVDG
jgi:hypothetical protein